MVSCYSILGILGGILGIFATVGYLRAILRRTTKPHLYTWVLWGTLASMATFVQIRNNAGWGILVPAVMGIFNISITFLSLKYGDRHLSFRDKILLGLAILTLVLWIFTQNDLLAVSMICGVDAIAFYFTWKKSYSKPYDEDIRSYVIWTVELACAFLAIEHLTLTNGLYPGFLASAELLFVLFLLWRRKVIGNK